MITASMSHHIICIKILYNVQLELLGQSHNFKQSFYAMQALFLKVSVYSCDFEWHNMSLTHLTQNTISKINDHFTCSYES